MKQLLTLFFFLFTLQSYGQSTTLLGNTNPTGLNLVKARKTIFDSSVVLRKYKAPSGDTMVLCTNDTGGIYAIPIDIVRTGVPGGSAYYPGFAVKIENDSIKVDTSITAFYFQSLSFDSTLGRITISNGNTIPLYYAKDWKVDSLSTHVWQQFPLYYTKTASDAKFELLANKKTNLTSPDNTGFPTTQAVATGLAVKTDTSATRIVVDTITAVKNRKLDKADTAGLNYRIEAKAKLYDTITIFSNNFTSNVGTGFTDVSNNSSYSGGLHWTNTQDGLPYGNYIRYDQGALSENYYMTVTFKFDATTDPARGLAVGLKSLNPYGYTHTVISGYDADQKKLYFRNSSTKFYGTDTATIYVGDSCMLIQKVKGLLYTVTLIDYTRGWTITYSQQLTPSGVPFSAHNAGNPVLHHVGGDYTVYNWSYKIIKPHDLDLVIKGNSIVEGQAAPTEAERWASNVLHQDHVYIAGGGADASYQLLQTLGEVILLKPKATLIFEGNDILFGTADSAWQANLRIIRDSLVRNGIAVIWTYPTPRNSTDMRGMKHWIDTFTSFRPDLKIDLYSPFHDSNTTYGIKLELESGDGLHLNATGHKQAANIINVGLQNGTNYSGQEGYLPVFTYGNSLKNSNVYQNNSNNIGINTTSPQYQLDVNGIGYFRGVLFSTTSVQTLGNMLALPALTSNEAISWGSQAAGSVAVSAAYGAGALNLGGVAKGKAKNMLDVYGGAVFGQALAVDSTAPTNGIGVQGAIKNDAGNYSSGGYKALVENDGTHLYENFTTKLTVPIDTTVTGDWSFSLPAGALLKYIIMYPGSNNTVNIGTTSGGGQILVDMNVYTHQPFTVSVGEAFDLSNSTTVYITGASGSIRYLVRYE